MLDWIIPDSGIVVEIPETDEMIRSAGGYLKYGGEDLEVIRKDKKVNEEDLLLGTIDRISGGGNPIVELEDEFIIVDQGEPGEEYLIERMKTQRGRVLSRVKPDSPV